LRQLTAVNSAKSAPSAAPATPPRREHRGDRRYSAGMNGDFAPMRGRGGIGTVVNA